MVIPVFGYSLSLYGYSLSRIAYPNKMTNSVVNTLHGHLYCPEKFETFHTSLWYHHNYKPHHLSFIVADERALHDKFCKS